MICNLCPRRCGALRDETQGLGRCRMLVVCGKEISNSMSAEIGMAEKRNIICTTLDGLARIKEAGEDNAI